ncbi:MAG: DUF1294 domain-containing protein [Massilia sp.]|nr:DUF1294 domain-containing protein [Massilia sp.]
MRYAPLLLFAALYVFASLRWGMPHAVGGVYLLASAACFAAYAIDKAAARAGRRRTPERTLLLMGLACGWPGALLAQQWLRHKSSKAAFRARFWATVGLNVGAFAWLAAPSSLLRAA